MLFPTFNVNVKQTICKKAKLSSFLKAAVCMFDMIKNWKKDSWTLVSGGFCDRLPRFVSK